MKKLHGMILLSTMIAFYSHASDDAFQAKKLKPCYDAFSNCMTSETLNVTPKRQTLISRSSTECLYKLGESENSITQHKQSAEYKTETPAKRKIIDTPRDSDDC